MALSSNHVPSKIGRIAAGSNWTSFGQRNPLNPLEGQAQIEPAHHRVGVRTWGPCGSPVDIPQIWKLPGAEFTELNPPTTVSA